jgi:tetratricopeptide (TPR) repeat protein
MALELDPSATWPNFYAGVCANQLGRHAEAVTAFSVCIGALPDEAECYYNRGIALFKLGRTIQALADYDFSIRLEPKLASAWLNRGILQCELRNYAESIKDLRQSLQLGIDPAIVHYNIARVHMAAGNRESARLEIDHALASGANHDLSVLKEQLETEVLINRQP